MVAEKDDEHVVLRRPNHPITVKNVLSHTSGLSFKSALEEPTLDLFPLAARVRSYAMTPLEFEPDSKYQYSNAGINTAARIIEVIAGIATISSYATSASASRRAAAQEIVCYSGVTRVERRNACLSTIAR